MSFAPTMFMKQVSHSGQSRSLIVAAEAQQVEHLEEKTWAYEIPRWVPALGESVRNRPEVTPKRMSRLCR